MSSGRFVGGLILGGLLGAVIALVTAPRSGEETRQWIKSQADEHGGHLNDEFCHQMDELRHRIDDVKAKAMQKAQEAADKFNEATKDVMDKVQEKIPAAKKLAQSLPEDSIN